jgi:uncharacterized protein
VFEGNWLYADDLLRQYLLLELPMAPVCREDCKGLCPTCGQNLNEASCDCAPKEGHPAFEALARAWYSED